jgi:hypothetical protein
MDDIGLVTLPVILPFMSVSAIIERGPSDSLYATVNTRMTVSGTVVANVPSDVDFHGGNKLRLVQNISSVVIQSAGTLKLEMEHEGSVIAQWETTLSLAAQPAVLSTSAEKVSSAKAGSVEGDAPGLPKKARRKQPKSGNTTRD